MSLCFASCRIISMNRLSAMHTVCSDIVELFISFSYETLPANTEPFGVVTVATNVAEVVIAGLLFLVLPVILM